MTGRVAIDFGTARTKLAYLPERGLRPELLRFVSDEGLERSFVPSLFYLPKGGKAPLVGDAAETMLQEDPAGVIDDLKRRLREPKCRANGRLEAPEDLLVLLFTDVRKRAGETIPAFGGHPPTAVSLTVPASFGPAQRDLLKAAAQRAGFEDVGEPIDEPVAAARGWLAEAHAAVERLVVLDCGGGTVDWAYLRRDGAGLFRLAVACPPGGIDRLGGHDVDNGLVELVEHKLAENGVESGEFSVLRRARLRARLRRIKETLLRGRDTITVRMGDAAVVVSREEVRAVIQGQFVTRATDGLRGYLAHIAGAENADECPPVLLVGGGARLEGLREAVEALGSRVLTWDRADFAASVGALAGEPPNAEADGTASLHELLVTAPTGGSGTALVRMTLSTRPPSTVFRDVDEPWCPEMVVLPRGEFWMGSPKDEANRRDCEGPRHRVRIDHDLAVGTCAVTFAEWDAWYRLASDETGREDETTYRPSDNGWGRGDRPVVNVHWALVQDYLKWFNARLGLAGGRHSYRLLSEAEWEYACRGGTDTPYWSGSDLPTPMASDCESGRQSKGSVRTYTQPVKSCLSNSFGLYWCHGNVWEWVQDAFSDNYNSVFVDESLPLTIDKSLRVRRGGAFDSDKGQKRSASRSGFGFKSFAKNTGFRVARRI